MDSCLNMVLIRGVLLIASLATTSTFRIRQSRSVGNMSLTTNIENLKVHYKTLGSEWVGKSVFASHLEKLNTVASCTCQSVLLERMLNKYEEIFQDMKNKSDTREVRENLTNVIDEVKKLKKRYKEEHNMWLELPNITKIKVKNGTVQAGALNDFLMVFNRASSEKEHDKRQ